MFTVQHAVASFWFGIILWSVSKALLMCLERRQPPRKLKTATQRFIERDWSDHGIYDPSRSTDWAELERTLEQTLSQKRA